MRRIVAVVGGDPGEQVLESPRPASDSGRTASRGRNRSAARPASGPHGPGGAPSSGLRRARRPPLASSGATIGRCRNSASTTYGGSPALRPQHVLWKLRHCHIRAFRTVAPAVRLARRHVQPRGARAGPVFPRMFHTSAIAPSPPARDRPPRTGHEADHGRPRTGGTSPSLARHAWRAVETTRGKPPMRVSLLVLPLVALGLAGCVDVHDHPTPREPPPS